MWQGHGCCPLARDTSGRSCAVNQWTPNLSGLRHGGCETRASERKKKLRDGSQLQEKIWASIVLLT